MELYVDDMQKQALNNAATAYNAGNYQCYPCLFF